VIPRARSEPRAASCDTRRVRVVLVAACALALCAGHARADTVEEIQVEGNTKTQRETVLLIARVSVGDEWKIQNVGEVRDRLVSSGLFSEVEVFWEPLPNKGAVRLHILAKDKHSWIIAPTFYDQPTNKGGGIGFGENNLFGKNQKLLLYGQVATSDSFFVGAWVLPNIGGSPLYAQFDTFLRSTRNIEYAVPTAYVQDPIAVRESRMHYYNVGAKLGVDILHGLRVDARLRAAHVSYHDLHLCTADTTVVNADPGCVHNGNATIADVPTNDASQIPKPGKEGWDVSNEWTVTIDRRANWYGVSTGYRYIGSFEYSVPSLGSDFHYFQFGLLGYRAWRVLERHNFVVKAQLHVGHHLPFQQEFLTGGTAMRGWINNQFRGDFQTLANIEYSFPLFSIPFSQPVGEFSVRGLAFFDTAYTTFLSTDNPERNYLPSSQWNSGNFFAPFKNSIGVGTRFYLRQLVLPLLGLDFGYGLEARDFQIYLAVGLTD
jgi:outer membrane protein assembly factor BamA